MYSKDFKRSNKILFYTSFGKYMRGSKPLYNINNKWLNYSTNVKPIYIRLNTTHQFAAVNIDIQSRDKEIQTIFYDQFKEIKKPFESILGNDWEWNEDIINEVGTSCSRISKEIANVNIYEKISWPLIFDFFKKNLLGFDQFWTEFNELFKQLDS